MAEDCGCTATTMGRAVLAIEHCPLHGAALELAEAAAELLEVADLRGDAELPAPADDPKLWSARMQTAWHELRAALAAAEGRDA